MASGYIFDLLGILGNIFFIDSALGHDQDIISNCSFSITYNIGLGAAGRVCDGLRNNYQEHELSKKTTVILYSFYSFYLLKFIYKIGNTDSSSIKTTIIFLELMYKMANYGIMVILSIMAIMRS